MQMRLPHMSLPVAERWCARRASLPAPRRPVEGCYDESGRGGRMSGERRAVYARVTRARRRAI